MKRRDAHPRARLPVGPCQAASHVFHRRLEASVHLLCAADTKRYGSQTVRPDRQKRCLEQVAGAAAREDRQTDNQTDRQQDQQTPSITSSLRRGEACSARDGPPGTGSRLTRFCLPLAGRLNVFVFFFFWIRRDREFRNLLLFIEPGQLWPSELMAPLGVYHKRAG